MLNIITVPLLSKFGSHSAKTGYLTVAVIYLSLIHIFGDQQDSVEMRYEDEIYG